MAGTNKAVSLIIIVYIKMSSYLTDITQTRASPFLPRNQRAHSIRLASRLLHGFPRPVTKMGAVMHKSTSLPEVRAAY